MRLISILLASVLLASCAASGVKMTDEEAAACRADGCTVWTDAELQLLIQQAFGAGFQRGAGQRGRSL